jgi:hypothetical protein
MSSLQKIADQNQNEVIECPICYEEIDQLKNCVTTECGHQFHCSCLMKNSATNGFSCPMCRSIMAEELADSDSEEYEEDEEEIDDDNALASFRMFHQLLAGEEVEEEPFEEVLEEEEEEEEEEAIVKPTATFIAAKLLTQGFTMKDLVNCLLVEHEEYDGELEANDRYSDQMFGKFRQIISNYPREMREQVEAEEQLAQGHQSSRHRSRAEVETNIGCLQNRYHVLQEDDDEDEDEV